MDKEGEDSFNQPSASKEPFVPISTPLLTNLPALTTEYESDQLPPVVWNANPDAQDKPLNFNSHPSWLALESRESSTNEISSTNQSIKQGEENANDHTSTKKLNETSSRTSENLAVQSGLENSLPSTEIEENSVDKKLGPTSSKSKDSIDTSASEKDMPLTFDKTQYQLALEESDTKAMLRLKHKYWVSQNVHFQNRFRQHQGNHSKYADSSDEEGSNPYSSLVNMIGTSAHFQNQPNSMTNYEQSVWEISGKKALQCQKSDFCTNQQKDVSHNISIDDHNLRLNNTSEITKSIETETRTSDVKNMKQNNVLNLDYSDSSDSSEHEES